MSAKELGRIIWRAKLVAVAVFVIIVGCGTLFLSRQSTVYESRSAVAVQPVSNNASAVSFYGNVVSYLIPTYIQLLSSPQFLAGVAHQLPFPISGHQLGHELSATPVSNAGVITIAADSSQPTHAKQIAAQATQDFTKQLSGNGIVTFQVYSAPQVPGSPIAPRVHLVLLVTVLLAIILALAAAIAWDRWFGRIHEAKGFDALHPIPLLGAVPDRRELRDGARILVGGSVGGNGAFDEALRSLRTNLIFSMGSAEAAMVAVTSPVEQAGKSTLVANLAVVTAKLGFRAVVIDADIYRPAQHRLFGVSNDSGFTSVLDGASPSELIQDTAYPGVRVVTSGPPLDNRTLEVSLYVEHLRDFAALGDIFFVDAPPLGATADIPLLAASARAALLAVRAGSTSLHQVRAALDSLATCQARVLGTVLTRSKDRDVLGGGSYYYAASRAAGVERRESV